MTDITITYANDYYLSKVVDNKYRTSQLTNIKAFLKYCEENNLTVKELTPKDALNYLEYLKTKVSRKGGFLSNSSINDMLNAVSLGYNELVKHGETAINPFSSIRKLPINKFINSYGAHSLEIDEVAKLFDVCETLRDRVILHLFYSAGLRRSEAERVRLSNISFTQNHLIVESQLKGKTKFRTIPLPSEVMEEIKEYVFTERVEILGNREDSNQLIISKLSLKNTGDTMYVRVLELSEQTSIPKKITPHVLRASFATHCLDGGMNPEYVQAILGHTILDTTNIYTPLNKR